MKTNLEVGAGVAEGRGRLFGAKAAAVAGCLMVVLGWSGAAAQFVTTADGYSVTHNAANNSLSQWDVGGDRGTWSVTTVGTNTGVAPPHNISARGFLTLKSGTYKCSDDGDYTVTFGMADANTDPWALRGAAVVFRYTGTAKFYALRLVWNYSGGYRVFFAKNALYETAEKEGAETELNTITGSTAGAQLTLRVTLRGDTIKVYNGTSTTPLGQIIDKDNPSGQVGYAHSAQYQRGALFYSSSWKDATPPPPTAYPVPAGYMVWNVTGNTLPDFGAGSGAWSGNFWADTNASKHVAWKPGSNAYFGGKGVTAAPWTVTVTGAQTVGNIRFDSTGYTISGAGSLSRATNGSVFVKSGKTATINTELAGAAAFVKDSAGTLTLGGANSYLGASTIRAGTLIAASSGALSEGAVTVNSGATLRLDGGVTLANALALTGGTTGGLVSAGSPNTLSGAVALSGSTAIPIAVNQKLTMSGIISPTGTSTAGITKSGEDTLILTGVNTYSGATTVSAGYLKIGNGAGGSVTGPIALSGANSRVIFNSGADATYAGAITGSGGLTKEGAGTLLLGGTTGTANTYSGTTLINGGAVRIMNPASIGSGTGGAITVAGGATLSYEYSLTGTHNLTKAVSGAGTFSKSERATLTVSAAVTTDSIKISGYNGAGSLVAAANLGSAASPSKILVASGTLSDSGAHTYTGSVNITGGTLEHKGAGTAGVLTISGPLTMGGSSTLSVQIDRNAKTTARIAVSGAVALGGTLNVISADTGTYTIISGASVTGTFAAITGVDNTANDVSTEIGATSVTLKITRKDGDAGKIQNYLNMVSAEYTGDDANGNSKVTLTLSGLNDLRPYLVSGTPSVSAVYIWYKPNAAVTPASMDTTVNGGRIRIPQASITGSGDIFTYEITVPAAKVTAAGDALFHFSVTVEWTTSSGASTPPVKGDVTAKLKNPKPASIKNGLTVTAVEALNTDGELSFDLTVSGQNGLDTQYVKSVGIWFQRNGTAPTANSLVGNGPLRMANIPGSDDMFTIPLTTLLANGQLAYSTGPVINNNGDEIYFSIAPLWTWEGGDSIARPLSVTHITARKPSDNTGPQNPVIFSAAQINKRADSVSVTLTVNGQFDDLAAAVRVEISLNSSMATPFSTKDFTPEEVSDGVSYTIKNDGFVGAERSVYYKVTVLDADEHSGEIKQGSFKVGREPPTQVSGFTAEAGPNGSMDLFWNPPTTANGIGDVTKAEVWIYYSATPITPDVNVSTLNLVGTVTGTTARPTATVTGLDQNKVYYFAAVLHDVVDTQKPAWTTKSVAAICSQNTGSTNSLVNVLAIDSAFFDDNARYFTVNVKLKADWTTSYKYGYLITLGADTIDIKNDGTPTVSRANQTFSFNSKLIEALVFDTIYTIYVYTINGQSYSGRDTWPVRIGAFTRQTVVVAPGGSGVVDNGNLKLDAIGWTPGSAPCSTTVIGKEEPKDDKITGKGFIAVGNYGYSYSAKSSDLSILGPFTISMKTKAEIPSDYTANDVKLYRWSGEYWEVVHDTKYANGYFTGTAIDPVKADTGYVYRLMINTGRSASGIRLPNVSTTNYAEIVDESKAIYESYTVTSNVGNCKVKMLYEKASGNVSFSDTAKATFSKDKGESRTVSFTISDGDVGKSKNSGLLSYVVVDDGSTRDTLNYSHRVRSSESDGFSVVPVPRKWLPFAAQVELDDKNVKTALRQLFYQDGDEVAKHDTLYRLYRWDKTTDNKSDWVPFDGDNDNTFKMDAWRLMWLKTSEAKPLIFGSAVSASLRDTVKIELPPDQWTDFVLPFRFNVCLGDILDATAAAAKSGSNALEFYKWVDPENSKQKHYITEPLALAVIDSSVELKGGDDPFTIYNPSRTAAVTLYIPPRPAIMSRHNKANKRGLTKTAAYTPQEAGGIWHYTLRTSTGDAVLPSVVIGYNDVERAFAVPPSFGDESVVLVDENGDEIGHHFSPSIVSGRTYKLRFYNDGKQRTVFTFSAQPSVGAPSSAQVTFVKASTSEILGGRGSEQSLSVAGMSHEDVFMIVGNNGYRAKAAAVTAGAKFAISRISVNRTARSARISYYVPESGVEQVEASIYDIKGRQIWKNVQRAKAASWNSMEWNGKGARASTSTGLYIVRVKAIGPNGATAGVDNKRIMFAR